MNKSFQHQQMGCVQLTHNNLGTALHCPNFWLEMSWKLKPVDASSPPRPQMEMGFVLGAAGSRCLSGHCLVLVHSAKQHNDVMASSDEAHAECWRFGKQMFICGWGSGINANPTSASAVISVLAAANPQPPESPPATLVTPLSVTSSSSFPLLFGLPSLFLKNW